MNDKTRGSDHLKMTCSGLPSLTQEELAQVSGGFGGLSYYLVFPKGIPWPQQWSLQQHVPTVNPAVQFDTAGLMTRLG